MKIHLGIISVGFALIVAPPTFAQSNQFMNEFQRQLNKMADDAAETQRQIQEAYEADRQATDRYIEQQRQMQQQQQQQQQMQMQRPSTNNSYGSTPSYGSGNSETVRSFAVCWENDSGFWFCDGPVQSTLAGERDIYVPLDLVGCDNSSFKQDVAASRGQGYIKVYECTRPKKSYDNDIIALYNLGGYSYY